MDGVTAAFDSAQVAEAATYAPAEFEAAREGQRSAVAEVDAQNAKFALTRSYKKATEMLAEAAEKAENARAAAVAGREEAKAAADDAVVSLTVQITAVEADLAALAAYRRKPKSFARISS
jgi:hypothetical protein